MANLNNTVRKKQYLLVGGLMVVIVGMSMIVVYTKNNTTAYQAPTAEKSDVVIERYSGLGSNVDEDEVWRATSSNEIDDLKTQNQKLVNEMRTMRSGISSQINKVVSEKTAKIQEKLDEEKRAERKKAQDKSIEAKKNALRAENAQSQKMAFVAPTVTQAPSNEIHVTRRAFERTNPTLDNPGLGSYKGDDLVKKREPKLHSISFGVEEIDTETELKKLNQVHQEVVVREAREGLSAKDYIPAGTFARALILGGIDAPTGGQAQDDPYPVLLELSDIAKLPNSFEYDLKTCRAIASGYGDISSERAIIRLEKISCVSGDGLVYETRIKGFVYDETGKVGMKGRLVSKQGQLIANGLLAGIGAGIGSAFQKSSTNYTTSALGVQSENFISAEDAAVAGVGNGVGTAFNRLSQYYIKLAEQIFPVIEIDAGRMVDLVFTSGFSLKPTTVAMVEADSKLNTKSGTNSEMTIGDLVNGTGQAINDAQERIRPNNSQY